MFHRGVSPLPPAIARLRRWYMSVIIWPFAGWARAVYWMQIPLWARSPWISYSIPVAMLTTAALLKILELRLRRRAAAANFQICPACLYPLEGDAGLCPECGRPFTPSTLRDAWEWDR